MSVSKNVVSNALFSALDTFLDENEEQDLILFAERISAQLFMAASVNDEDMLRSLEAQVGALSELSKVRMDETQRSAVVGVIRAIFSMAM